MKYNESEPMSAVDDVYGTLAKIIAEVELCQREGCIVEHFEAVQLKQDYWRMTIWYNNENYLPDRISMHSEGWYSRLAL